MMNEYQASIASVDHALNRLNQTLASYRLFAEESAKSSASSSAASKAVPAVAREKEDEVGEIHDAGGSVPWNSGLSGLKPTSDSTRVLGAILGLRSSKRYPEVCTVYLQRI
jgi:hypothetical protein